MTPLDTDLGTTGTKLDIDQKQIAGSRLPDHLQLVFMGFLEDGELYADTSIRKQVTYGANYTSYAATLKGAIDEARTKFESLKNQQKDGGALGTPSQLDLTFEDGPVRIVYFIDSPHWGFVDDAFRFVGGKPLPGRAPTHRVNNTFNHREKLMSRADGLHQAVTVVNWCKGQGRGNGYRFYSYELELLAKYKTGTREFGTKVIIDPGVGNDGDPG